MSDTASIRSHDGTASEYSDVSVETAPSSERSRRARSAPNESTSALTEENLERNANQVRLDQPQSTVDRIAAAFASMSNDELPNKTIGQLMEGESGASPMQRFLETSDDRRGNPVSEEFWNDLKPRDLLAAELHSM